MIIKDMLDQNPTALPVKKQWLKPKLTLIDQEMISNKAQSSHHEASFTAIKGHPGSYHFNGGGSFHKSVVTTFVS